jgi:hypothetical protein
MNFDNALADTPFRLESDDYPDNEMVEIQTLGICSLVTDDQGERMKHKKRYGLLPQWF